MDGTVLIADDDRSIRMVLTQALTRAGCRVHATGSLAQLWRWVEEGRGDLVITDVVMPDGNGIDMIPAIRRARPDLPVIVISAQNTIVTTIRATEARAFDYLPKPFDLPDLMALTRQALTRKAQRSPARMGADGAPDSVVPQAGGQGPALPLIGGAPVMQALFRSVAQVLNTDLAVLVSGPAGSGKTLLARALHDLSDRRDRPIVTLSPADASSGALARARTTTRGGTLLIEDLTGFDADGQARLGAALDAEDMQPGRIIATCGPNPAEAVSDGRLRADLYYRLAGVIIEVPALSQRLEDVPALVTHFLNRAEARGLPPRRVSSEAMALLRGWPFPGNVRELENLMNRLALTAPDTEIDAETMRAALGPAPGVTASHLATLPLGRAGPGEGQFSAAIAAHLKRYFDMHGDELPPPGLYDRFLREVEAPLIQVAMDAVGGNQLRCAELLGINRNTLRKKLTELKIEVTRRRKLS